MAENIDKLKIGIKSNIELLIEQQRFVEAKKLISEYVMMVPNDVEAFSMQAVIAVLEGRLGDAKTMMQQGIAMDSTHFDCLYNLAYVYELENEQDQAISIYKRLCRGYYTRKQQSLAQQSYSRLTRTTLESIAADQVQENNTPIYRVLQGTIEIANQMNTLTLMLRNKGWKAEAVNYFSTYLNYAKYTTPDFTNCKNQDEMNRVVRNIAMEKLRENDIFHFHFGTTLTFDGSDLPLYKETNKKVLMHYWGSDIRQLSIARQFNPYAVTKVQDERQIIENIYRIAKYVPSCIVGDAELFLYIKKYFNEVYCLPQAIDINKYKPVASLPKERLLIVHAPTSPEIKGTKYVLQAVERLQAEFDFDFQLVHGLSHEEALKIYKKADLVIDQLLGGGHGLFALESMSMGKPVICWISDYMTEHYPEELPIIRANPDTITEVLRYILQNQDYLPEIGRQGRLYVEKYHDAVKVADQLIDIYRSLQ